MKSLQVKKAIFNESEIVLLNKKGNIVLTVGDIERIEYVKPSALNYLFSATFFGGTYPGRLQIYLNQKINNKKLYLVKIRFNEVLKLPKFYLRKIDPSNNWGSY